MNSYIKKQAELKPSAASTD